MAGIDVTNLDRVVKHGQISGGAKPELRALLGDLITSVSETFEQYMGRFVKSETRTQYFDVDECSAHLVDLDDESVWYLRGWPVSSVTSVKNTEDGDFSSGAYELTAGSDYIVPKRDGRLRIRSSLSVAVDGLEVVYVGGMAATTKAFIETYPDIAKAADVQVMYEYLRRKNPQAATVSNAGGTVEQQGELKLLKKVAATLDKHKQMGALIG